jgi:hypothetical protein
MLFQQTFNNWLKYADDIESFESKLIDIDLDIKETLARSERPIPSMLADRVIALYESKKLHENNLRVAVEGQTKLHNTMLGWFMLLDDVEISVIIPAVGGMINAPATVYVVYEGGTSEKRIEYKFL